MDSGTGSQPRGDGGNKSNHLIGATLGNYRVGGLLGQGGMGSVYLAEHVLIGRKVAIKVLDPQIADQADSVSRFFIEARAVNEIRHPNIVEVTDLGTHEGRPFIVMEYLGGETLERRLLQKTRLAPDDAVHVTRQVASALGAAHDRGLVHRDLKPANVMLVDHPDYPDFVKVLDFGIAKLVGASSKLQHQTEVGALLGTPAFMSPEQCLGDLQLDHRSDVYSLGVMMFLMFTGRLPFEGEAVGRLILAHVHQAPPRITHYRPELPETLAEVVDRALAKKPNDRFGSMRDVRRALDEACGRPRSLTPIVEVTAPPPTTTPTIVTGGPSLRVAAAAARPIVATGRPVVAPVRTPGPSTGLAPVTPLVSPRPTPARPTPADALTPRPTPTPVGGISIGESREGIRQRVAETVADRVKKGALAFPAMPDTAAQCLQLLRDPGYLLGAVAQLVRKDGRLASHLVRRANSDGVAGRGVSTTPEQAMARLGSEWVRVAIVELGARRAIDFKEPRFEDLFRRPWQHALASAIAADRLARLSGAEALAPSAYMGGLLRDAGISLLAQLLIDVERELAGRKLPRATPIDEVVEIVNRHARRVTADLVRRWQLPEAIGQAIEEGGSLDAKGGWSLRNVVATAAAIADREGFYLRRESVPEAEAIIEAAARDLGLPDLRARKVADRLKEAVRLKE